MKNFRHKSLVFFLSFAFGAFLVLPCCQIVHAQTSEKNHSCCAQQNPIPCPLDSSGHHSTDCPKAKNFLEVKSIESYLPVLTQWHAHYYFLSSYLLHNSLSQSSAALVLTGPNQKGQSSLPLYLLHSILRI